MEISKELLPYEKDFKRKTILCNGGGLIDTNLISYFIVNYKRLKLKGLSVIVSPNSIKLSKELKIPCYDSAKYYIINFSDLYKGDDIESISKNSLINYISSEEHVKSLSVEQFDEVIYSILKETDLAVSYHSPIGFHKYFNYLMESSVDFLVLCRQSLASHQLVFPYIKNGWVKVVNSKCNDTIWLTTLDTQQVVDKLKLDKTYSPEKYVKYDNYNALHLNRISNIPVDYTDLIGVPLTFITKWNPNQFKLIDRVVCSYKGKLLPRLIIKRVETVVYR